MAKSKRLSELNEVELTEMLDEAKDDLFNLRFQSVIGQLDNHSLIKQTKKEVARLLTELRSREIDQAEAAEAAKSVVASETEAMMAAEAVATTASAANQPETPAQ